MESANPKIRSAVELFTKTMVPHPLFDQIRQSVLGNIRIPSDRRLIPVIGPTGVGKTALMRTIVHDIVSSMKQELENDVNIHPVLSITIDPQKSVMAAMKDMYAKLLLLLDGLSGKRSDPTRCKIGAEFQQVSSKDSETALRNATFDLIKKRRPKVILIDEGQHLIKARSGGEASFQFDALKRMADDCGVPFILIGHYDLFEFISEDSQLSRRSNCQHFAPYDWGKKADRKAFTATVNSFQEFFQEKHLTFDNSQPEYFFELCLGCVGTLKTMLAEAYAQALEDKLTVISSDLVASKSAPFRSRKNMLQDIITGRTLFSTTDTEMNDYRAQLGLSEKSRELDCEKSGGSAIHKVPVGAQKPKRNPIGIPQELSVC